MGLRDKFKAFIGSKREEKEERRYKALRERAIRGELSPEETSRFVEESSKRSEQYLERERQKSAQSYRETMRAENYFFESMKQLEDAMEQSPSTQLEKSIVNEQVDELFLPIYGCTKSDWNLLLEAERLVTDAEESSDLKKLKQAEELIFNRFIKGDRNLFLPILNKNMREVENNLNKAQKKVQDVLLKCKIAKENIRYTNRNQTLGNHGDARYT